MESKKKKNIILYIVIAILIVGIVVMGILMITNNKNNLKKNLDVNGGQGEMIMQDAGNAEGVIKTPSIDIPDDGKGIQFY